MFGFISEWKSISSFELHHDEPENYPPGFYGLCIEQHWSQVLLENNEHGLFKMVEIFRFEALESCMSSSQADEPRGYFFLVLVQILHDHLQRTHESTGVCYKAGVVHEFLSFEIFEGKETFDERILVKDGQKNFLASFLFAHRENAPIVAKNSHLIAREFGLQMEKNDFELEIIIAQTIFIWNNCWTKLVITIDHCGIIIIESGSSDIGLVYLSFDIGFILLVVRYCFCVGQ